MKQALGFPLGTLVLPRLEGVLSFSVGGELLLRTLLRRSASAHARPDLSTLRSPRAR
jgi:hypothetical protein